MANATNVSLALPSFDERHLSLVMLLKLNCTNIGLELSSKRYFFLETLTKISKTMQNVILVQLNIDLQLIRMIRPLEFITDGQCEMKEAAQISTHANSI